MSDYTNSLKLPSSFSFTEMSHFAELSENDMENTSPHFTPLSTQSLLSNQPEAFSFPPVHNLPNFHPHDHHKPVSEPATDSRRKRATANYLEEEDNSKRRKEGLKESARSRNSEGGEKQKEVVHVRARRGQATDSHSLAERVRRERINEKMRCLQDLVPGCYKTMGTATMLDEIINYVHSLQNQVEFLSMKLSAASSFYDFDLDVQSMTAATAAQQIGNAHNEPQNNDKSERYQSYGSLTSFNSPFPF